MNLEDLITHTVPFREVAHAYALIDQPPDDLLQVVLDYELQVSGAE